MNHTLNLMRRVIALACVVLMAGVGGLAQAKSSAKEIDMEVDLALQRLYRTTPAAEKLAKTAKAVLVFPSIVKAGFGVGGQYGEGALRQDGKTVGYYSSAAVSYGLQIGAQTFGYAMFLMTPAAVKHLDSSDGWEVGVGPSVVLVDEGMAKTMTTTTTRDDIYAFIFGQKGLMAGAGIQGSKIQKIKPGK